MSRRSRRMVNSRRGCWWMFGGLAAFIILGLILFVATYSRTAPFIEQKLESARYRLLAYLPQPEHPEFAPTPIRTAALVRPTRRPSSTATATAKPTDVPTRAPQVKSAATSTVTSTRPPTATATPSVPVKPIQASVQLNGIAWEAQRWNNCGPTTLKMYLSFFGFKGTQMEIATVLKPDADDKNVGPDELAAYAESKGMLAMVRVNGTLDRIKTLLSNGLPLIVETGFDPPRAHDGWMGHYRLVTGYDDKKFNTMDSYDGANVPVAINAFDTDWRAFNRTYVLVYPKAQVPLVRSILGDDANDKKMYEAGVDRAQNEMDANPNDPFAAFNLGSNLVGLKQYDEAAEAFDRARSLKLPWRMLWYQFGPYEAYYRVGRYDELVALTTATLKTAGNLEESYYYKGLALEKLGRTAEAREAFGAALRYNKNFQDAQRALASLNVQ